MNDDIKKLAADLVNRDLRERRRSNRWIRNALRGRTRAADRWWSAFGAALVPFALAFVALLPMAALGVWVAIEVTS